MKSATKLVDKIYVMIWNAIIWLFAYIGLSYVSLSISTFRITYNIVCELKKLACCEKIMKI